MKTMKKKKATLVQIFICANFYEELGNGKVLSYAEASELYDAKKLLVKHVEFLQKEEKKLQEEYVIEDKAGRLIPKDKIEEYKSKMEELKNVKKDVSLIEIPMDFVKEMKFTSEMANTLKELSVIK